MVEEATVGRDDLGDAFAFVNKADSEPGPLRPPGKKRSSHWRAWVVAPVGLLLHGVILAAFLNFLGIVRIPKWDGFTKERLMPQAPAPVSVRPPAPARQPRAVVVVDRRPGRPAQGSPPATRPPEPARSQVAATVVANNPRRSLQALRNPPPADQAASAPAPLSPIAEAEALLKSKGVSAGTAATVLESEATARSKLVALRSKANEFNEAYERLAAIRLPVVQLQEVEEQLTTTNARIGELNFQMSQFSSYSLRGIVYHGMNTQENDLYESLKADRLGQERGRDTELIPARNRLRSRQPGREVEARATATLDLRKEAGLTAMKELRAAVAETKLGYENLANDSAVKAALAKLGQAKLAPSPEFLADVKELGRFEKSLGLKPTFP